MKFPRYSLGRATLLFCCFSKKSAALSFGVFLSIRANARPPSSQWIPTKLTSSPTSLYSTPPLSASIPLQLFLGSLSTSLFPSFQDLMLCLCFLMGINLYQKNLFLFCLKDFFAPFLLTLHPDGFLYLAIPILPNWNPFTERLVAPSLAASRPPSSHFSLKRLYLPYDSSRLISP